MKKVLFATTALIATAGVASADITLTGGANLGYRDTGTQAAAYQDMDFNIVASGVSDNGLSFGASMDIDGDTANTTTTSATGTSTSDPEVYVTGAFGTITVGEVAPQTDIGMSDIGLIGLSVDDLVEADRHPAVTADVRWNYSVNGLSVGASVDTVADDTSLSIGYAANGFSGTIAINEDAATSDKSTVVLASYTLNGLTVTGLAVDFEDASSSTGDTQAMGLHLAYAVDSNLTISAAFANNDEGSAADTDTQGIGFSYNMGGGLTLAGGAGESSTNQSVFDLGLAMSF